MVYKALTSLLILHENKICHMDIKPGNIFYHENKMDKENS